MYAFRHPFKAVTYDSVAPIVLWDSSTFQAQLTYKSALVISQVIGYAISKFLGIKFVSEATPQRRAGMIVGLIAMAELALLGFASVPRPINIFFLFLNGLPLGMVWGLVFGFLEGRRLTEIMGLVLCASFTFASSMVKDVGRILCDNGISEFWMPFVTGLLFLIPLLASLWLLDHIPPPSPHDIQHRTRREPMHANDRSQVFRRYALGITCLVVVYIMLTAYRDFRETFMADILQETRGSEAAVPFSKIELPVTLAVLAALMGLVLIHGNFAALAVNHVVVLVGCLSAGVATVLYRSGYVNDVWWLGITGFATYVAYVPFNCILFDRLIAAFRQVSNVGFFIYLADSFGYLGSVLVLIYKDFGAKNLSWVDFFQSISLVLAVAGGVTTIASLAYFVVRYRQEIVGQGGG
jgi:hypothetical protein